MLARQLHELLRMGPPIDPPIYQATVFSFGAASVLVVWDTLLTLDDEVDYIWTLSGRAHIKWIYLLSRWFGLLNQICSPIWLYYLAKCAPAPMPICEGFFVYEAATFQFLQLCLNAILVLRLWAVHQRHSQYIVAALAIVAFETCMSVLAQALSVPKSTVDGTCLILHAPATIMCLWIGMIVSQSLLLLLTYRRKALLMPAAGNSRLVTVLARDGMLVFGVVMAIAMTSVLYLIFNQAFINISWPWMPVVPSILTPRMILNMRIAADQAESRPEFTTDLGTLPHNETLGLTHVREVTVADL